MNRLIDKFIFALAALFICGAVFSLMAVITDNIRRDDGLISITACLVLSGFFFGIYRIITILDNKNR